jgi:3-keto-5-aminohexanoate cleavage enzyme
MTTGTLITVVPLGPRSLPSDNAALPVSLIDQLVAAKECEALGASVLTVPLRDEAGRPALDYGRLRTLILEVRKTTDLVIRLGADSDLPEGERLRALEAGPETASCSLGDRPGFVQAMITVMGDLGVVPDFEITEPDQLATLERLLPAGGRAHVTLLISDLADLLAGLPVLERLGVPFSASGLGGATLPVLMTALATGGHLRVGMADTTAWSARQAVESNMQLVARAVGFAQLAQRPPLTTKEARELLGVSPR